MEATAEAMSNQAGAALGQAAGNLLGKAMREKTWDESDTERRMEMMREEVRYLRRTVTDLQNTIRKLTRHQHAQDGSLTVPLNNRDADDMPRGYVYDPLK